MVRTSRNTSVKSTRNMMNKLFDKKDSILEEIADYQSICAHKTSVYRADGSSGNWDNDAYYWYDFYCYDCRKRWTHEQSLGHGNSLKVEKIDPSRNPEVIEAMMRVEELKGRR